MTNGNKKTNLSLAEKHFRETDTLTRKVDKPSIAKWLLEEGYFAEQYVLPPCFKVKEFSQSEELFFPIQKDKDGKVQFSPPTSELLSISFPKTALTERTFSIIDPKIYHDIVFHLIKEWDLILNHLFDEEIKIFSYSFPIPISSSNEGKLGKLRAGRMIYEFIEMAENDLVAEAHGFNFLVKTDIKNFYPSVYTHSIAWALHGKEKARKDRFSFNLLGNKLDKLFQCANDGCTNGLPIGSAASDLISEIILAGIDKKTSKILKKEKVNFLGVRFKDDYYFLCESKADTERIIKVLQTQMQAYNLNLNEEKTKVRELPEGLFRLWTLEYQKHSLLYKKKISYKKFESTFLAVLRIDKEFPGTGVIDKFLRELFTKRGKLKLNLKKKEIFKVFSLLLLLKERRSKVFPQILAVFETIFDKYENKQEEIFEPLYFALLKLVESKFKRISENQYDLMWLCYFLRTQADLKGWPKSGYCKLLKSIKHNNQSFFNSDEKIKLYNPIKKKGANEKLFNHLAIFNKM